MLLNDITGDFNLLNVGSFQNVSTQMHFTHFQGASQARLDRLYVSVDLLDALENIG